MRRTRLIWFALGAGIAGFFSAAVSLMPGFITLDDSTTKWLVIEEEPAVLNGDDIQGVFGAKLFRDCGAKFVQIEDYGHGRGVSKMPLIDENFPSLECAYLTAKDQDVDIELVATWALDTSDLELHKRTRIGESK